MPNVPDSIDMNEKRILSIVGQGSIYLLSEKTLDESACSIKDQQSDSELEKCPWERDENAVNTFIKTQLPQR